MHKKEEPDMDDLIRRSEHNDDVATDCPPTSRQATLPPLENALASIGAGSDIQIPSYNTISDLCISPDQGDWQTQATERQPRGHSGGQLGANLLPLFDSGRAADRESDLGQRQPGLLSSVGLGPTGPRNARSDTVDTSGSLGFLAAVAVDRDSHDHGPCLEFPEHTTHDIPQVEMSELEAPSSSPEEVSSPPTGATVRASSHLEKDTGIKKALRDILNGIAGLKKIGSTSNSASQTGSRIAQSSKPSSSNEPQRDLSVEIIEPGQSCNVAQTAQQATTHNEVFKVLTELLKEHNGNESLLPRDLSKQTTVEGVVKCTEPGCKAVLLRKCDLKKHMKRHTKPYGCTFYKCEKSFGSKNDWKRHESTQHFQHEAWLCLVSKAGTQKGDCANPFYGQEHFERHLQDNHQFRNKAKLSDFSDKCRMGRNGLHQYWCGFCKELHPVKNVGIKAWDERFNHIDEMFKEGRKIGEWLCVESNKTKGEEAAADRSGSPDGDSSPSPPDTANRRTPSPGSSGAYVSLSQVSKKRPRDDNDEVNNLPAKKQKRELVFNCCKCGHGPWSLSLFSQCVQCDHAGCEQCNWTYLSLQENDGTAPGLDRPFGSP
ncbi:hypothetical protein H2201_000544 [Coniosporium apollinis]|uniref:C2H2-type domain-containing protein n=1 Tax=Coniosporium apollinis TaxID=61459 RepID=A0ABQ9P4H8_9PEZI|nr:hypothetical protein H2201_000544 [Coniosporium apollinis]